MATSIYDDELFRSWSIRILIGFNCEVLYVLTTNWSAKGFLLKNDNFREELFLKEVESIFEISWSVWNASCHENFIIFMLKSIKKWKIVKPWWLLDSIIIFSSLFEILYLLASWSPIISSYSTSYVWSETSLIEGVRLPKAEYVEFDLCSLTVFDWKVKPLHVAVGIGVISHVEIILLGGNPQISPDVLSKRRTGCLTRICCWTRAYGPEFIFLFPGL